MFSVRGVYEERLILLLPRQFHHFQIKDAITFNFKAEHGAYFMKAVLAYSARVHVEEAHLFIVHHL